MIAIEALTRAGHDVTADVLRLSQLTARRGASTITVSSPRDRGLRYPFWLKTDWQPADDVYACQARLPEGPGDTEAYLIPTREWAHPDVALVSRDYEGRRSLPEWRPPRTRSTYSSGAVRCGARRRGRRRIRAGRISPRCSASTGTAARLQLDTCADRRLAPGAQLRRRPPSPDPLARAQAPPSRHRFGRAQPSSAACSASRARCTT